MRDPSHPGQVLLPVDHEAVQPRGQDWVAVGARRCHPLPPHVPQTIPHLQVHLQLKKNFLYCTTTTKNNILKNNSRNPPPPSVFF